MSCEHLMTDAYCCVRANKPTVEALRGVGVSLDANNKGSSAGEVESPALRHCTHNSAYYYVPNIVDFEKSSFYRSCVTRPETSEWASTCQIV